MFDYAHNNTEKGERESCTAQFNSPKISARLQEMRAAAFAREIPTSDDETLCFLQTLLCALRPKNILELGSATGISAAFFAETLPEAKITTIERNENFFAEAQKNFRSLNIADRIEPIFGDAGEEIIKLNEAAYDFIFLDCAKAQYVKYVERLKTLLKRGGVLVADDVLLYGYVAGERETPKKRRMLVEHLREYIAAVTKDSELSTTIINAGNGLAVSVKL